MEPLSEQDKLAVIPPIFKWAESLSDNLEKLKLEIADGTNKLEQFHREQTQHTNKVQSPPRSVRSSHLLSPITVTKDTASAKSPSSIQSGKSGKSSTTRNTANANAPVIQQTIISFEPKHKTTDAAVTEPQSTMGSPSNKMGMFSDLPQSIHSTANRVTTDGERIIADVAKKIWGNDVPQTFLTALDMEIDISSDDAHAVEDADAENVVDPYSAYNLAYSSKGSSRAMSRVLSAKRHIVTLPALEVTKEIVPAELKTHCLGLPSKVSAEELIPKIIETTQFESKQQKRAFKETVMCGRSVDIIGDAFWWFLVTEWKMGKSDDDAEMVGHNGVDDNETTEDNEEKEIEAVEAKAEEELREVQSAVFGRMAKNYVALFLSAPQKLKDVVFDNYYDLLSQSVFSCLTTQYPKSRELFTDELKLKLLRVTARWTMGLVPSSLSMSHWDIAAQSKQKQRERRGAAATHSSSGALELLDTSTMGTSTMGSRTKAKAKAKAAAAALSECVIPTQITRRDVVFRHSELVQHFLEHEAVRKLTSAGDKTTVRISLTFAKPNGEKLLFHRLNEEALQCGEDTEKARAKLISTQKELNKMIRNDKNALKDYENEAQQQLFIATKNKKQFVKNILKQLVPTHADGDEEDHVYV